MPSNVKVFKYKSCQVLVQEELAQDATDSTDIALGWYVWPSAVVLADFIASNPNFIVNMNVIELGSGTALPGLLASMLGATHVLLTDKSKDELDVAARSIQLNKLSQERISTKTLLWGDISPLDFPVDVVLAADCFYDPKDFEAIIATLASICKRNPSCQVIIAYQLRSVHYTIQPYLTRFHLQAQQLCVVDNIYLILLTSTSIA
ncbi:hypothetical protein THRCLA_22025 [Thraustotheca clavata]|uniref:Uncharacterized protein n=1 Tax=Thraustotheca clavata TaxID=74557 RepID=A0A1V9ZDI0_9STRA|nr:hypothetical protein THRCLA_22025 [Thraustotheca clavata]